MFSNRTVLTGSALALGVLGLAALFLPAHAAMALGLEDSATGALSLAAPGLLGMASLDWIGRASRVGGLHGRSLSVANLLTGAVGTSTLARLLSEQGGTALGWSLAAASGVYTVLFVVVMVRPTPDGDGVLP
jgi:hypothetical protein